MMISSEKRLKKKWLNAYKFDIAKLFFLVFLSCFFYACKIDTENDQGSNNVIKSVCNFESSIVELIKFDIPKYKFVRTLDSSKNEFFHKKYATVYDLNGIEILSTELFILDSNYYLAFSVLKSEECGNVYLVSIFNNKNEALFYNIDSNIWLVNEFRWKLVDGNVFVYLKTLLKQEKGFVNEVFRTIEIAFNFENNATNVAVDDGFSNW